MFGKSYYKFPQSSASSEEKVWRERYFIFWSGVNIYNSGDNCLDKVERNIYQTGPVRKLIFFGSERNDKLNKTLTRLVVAVLPSDFWYFTDTKLKLSKYFHI